MIAHIYFASLILTMASEKSLIWLEIKKAAPEINKVGGNAIELLIWSQGKGLAEVQRKIQGILETENLSEEELRNRELLEEEKHLKLNSDADNQVRFKAGKLKIVKSESVEMGEQQQREAWITEELRNGGQNCKE